MDALPSVERSPRSLGEEVVQDDQDLGALLFGERRLRLHQRVETPRVEGALTRRRHPRVVVVQSERVGEHERQVDLALLQESLRNLGHEKRLARVGLRCHTHAERHLKRLDERVGLHFVPCVRAYMSEFVIEKAANFRAFLKPQDARNGSASKPV
jgi:hypothetical protein